MTTLSIARIVVPLGDAERAALAQMSETDMRFPKQQIQFLIREEAKRRGLLQAETTDQAAAWPGRKKMPPPVG